MSQSTINYLMKNQILIVGSTNTDMVVKTNHFPQPGETILGGEFCVYQGGKGANQAVAAARLGGDVVFISKLGNDSFGLNSIAALQKENIDTTQVLIDDKVSSGVALITVDKKGENNIVVAPGANNTLLPENIEHLDTILEKCKILLVQLEIPLKTVQFVCQRAKEKGIIVVLNPAPATKLDESILKYVDILTPNETECELLTGLKINDSLAAVKAINTLLEMGVSTVVITLGKRGAYVYENNELTLVPTKEVFAIDSTGAGDVFNGALVVGLAQDKTLVDAVRLACEAAAISVTKMGAQSSAPTLEDLNTSN